MRRKSRAPRRPARRPRSRTTAKPSDSPDYRGGSRAKSRVGPDYRGIVVAGRGNVGRSLVQAFHAAGRDARLVASREPLPPVDGIVFLAVPDGAVTDVARRIAKSRPALGTAFVHVSGALGLDALAPLADHDVGSFHPLQSFPSPQPPEAFRGITVAVDASSTRLERRLAGLAQEIGARPRHVGDAERVPYHAAAVLASNYVVALVNEAAKMLRAAGWTQDEAERALLPLVEGAVASMRSGGTVKALTGPVRRGDADTVRRHLEAVENPELYRMLGSIALEIAKEAGLEPAAAGRIKRALTRDAAATRRRGRG